MNLIAIRHGQTDYNRDGVVMGSRIDAPLNETGREQVHSLIPDLQQHTPVAVIYSSPLMRAKETAAIINEAINAPIVYRDELKERDVGTLSGMTHKEVYEKTGMEDTSDEYDFSDYGGESAKDVRERLKHFLASAQEEHPEDTVLVVTHKGLITTLYALHKQKPTQSVGNVCVHEFK